MRITPITRIRGFTAGYKFRSKNRFSNGFLGFGLRGVSAVGGLSGMDLVGFDLMMFDDTKVGYLKGLGQLQKFAFLPPDSEMFKKLPNHQWAQGTHLIFAVEATNCRLAGNN